MSTPSSALLKVAWINDFPIEWLLDIPEPLRKLPRLHARSWQQVLLQEFQNAGAIDLHIFVFRRRVAENAVFRQNGVTFHVMKLPPLLRDLSHYWYDTRVLARELGKLSPDVVHAWGNERGAALVARRLGYPYLITVQGLFTWYRELIPLNSFEKLAGWMEKQTLPGAPLVTTESTFAVSYLQANFPGIRVFQAEHAPKWAFHQVNRAPQTAPFRFLFIGFMGYRKGFDLLVRALEAIRNEIDFELVVVSNMVEPAFKEQLRELQSLPVWNRIHIRQSLGTAEIAEELSRATMVLFPTRADTSPNAVKEAVVAGIPVIASSIGGIVDYVISGKNGFTFPSDNIEAFITALRKACQHHLFRTGFVDPETLSQARRYLSPTNMASRFLEAYEIVCRRRTYPISPFSRALLSEPSVAT
jgi:glycosyltransferase involved in cell wall biosynthesis